MAAWVTILPALLTGYLGAAHGLGQAALAGPPALWVVVHPNGPAQSLDRDALRAIFTSERRFWPDGSPVVAINAPSKSPSRTHFDREVLGMSPDEAGRYWVNQQVRGAAPAPRKATSRLAALMVGKLASAIAYIPAETCVPRGLRVVAVIASGSGGVRAGAPEVEACP